jgi:hypothetical protein
MRWHRGLSLAVAGLVVVAGVLAGSAGAAKPTFELIAVDDTFPDDVLTEACGVPVTTHVEGRILVREFSGGKLLGVNTVNVVGTATAGDNTVRFRDVGADHARVTRDGSVEVMIIGRLPFDFTGVLKINPDTGEVLHEPTHFVGTDKACAALTA